VESIARKEFGLVRPNEVIYQFPSRVTPEQNNPVTAPPQPDAPR